MRTIAFFSYKGGTGKSLATANMAVCLSRLGKNVAVLDADFDGPALPYKLGARGLAATGKGGLAAYLDKYIDQTSTDRVLKFHPSPGTENPLQTYVGQVEPARSNVGTVHLISAGDIFADRYWEFLEGDKLANLFSFGSNTDVTLSDEDTSNYFGFLLSLKRHIASLTPAPDYLLIDLRNGMAETSSFFMQYWADSVACLFFCNRENIDCYQHVLNKVRSLDRSKHLGPLALVEDPSLVDQVPDFAVDVVPVLTRTPKDIQEHKGMRALHTVLQQLDLSNNDLRILHSDRNLEMWETLRFDFHKPPFNVQLTHEYISLFARLMVGSNVNEYVEAKKEDIRDALKLPAQVAEEERVFVIHRHTGSMINPSDGSRNVSFKVTTFNFLLEEMRSAVLKSMEGLFNSRGNLLKGADDSHRQDIRLAFDDALRHAGFACGLAFGQSLVSVWVPGSLMDTEVDRVKRWATFDSDVGFGLLSFVRESSDDGLIKSGVIHLRESFLTNVDGAESSMIGHHDRCEFMSGYIEGVLGTLLNRRYEVKHEPGGFESDVSQCESCQFLFSIERSESANQVKEECAPISQLPR